MKPHKQATTEMRWFGWYVKADDGKSYQHRKLQYRQKLQVRPVNASEWREGYTVDSWSDWIDVPTVWEDEQ